MLFPGDNCLAFLSVALDVQGFEFVDFAIGLGNNSCSKQHRTIVSRHHMHIQLLRCSAIASLSSLAVTDPAFRIRGAFSSHRGTNLTTASPWHQRVCSTEGRTTCF